MVDLGSPQAIRGGDLAGLGEARMSSGLMPGAVALDAGAGTVTVASPVNYFSEHQKAKRKIVLLIIVYNFDNNGNNDNLYFL